MQISTPKRWMTASVAGALVASVVALSVGVADAQVAPAASAAPTVTGEPCAPGTGVTVVVDYQSLGDITVGCALGEQTDGFSALTNAGFTYNESPGAPAGYICQITTLPSDPGQCVKAGFWSYLKSDGTTPWTSSGVGAADGPLPIDSVEGWAWTSPIPLDYTGELPRIAVADLPALLPTDPTTTTTTTTAATTSTTVPTDPPVDGCSTPLSGDGGADAALDWLACELEANDGSMPGFSPGTSDYGLTIDAILAFTTNGRGDDHAAVTAAGIIEAGVGSYVTDQDFGDGTERYSGALAKSLLMAELRGADVDDFGGFDLDDEVLARMQTSGPEAGRFSDQSQYGDYSNGFGQTLAILGLSYTDAGVPTVAVDFLLDQQCPGGGFRGTYSDDDGCAADTEADTDYTGLAIEALLAVPASADVDGAVEDATDWLLARQDGSGAFGGTGVTTAVNTNSAGFAAQALRAVGETDAADGAAAWIQTVQITTDNAGSPDVAARAAGPAAADLGAIGYDPAALETALADGIGDQVRDQFRRASAQAALAFRAGPFGAPRQDVPTTTTTTAPVASTTVVSTPTDPSTTLAPNGNGGPGNGGPGNGGPGNGGAGNGNGNGNGSNGNGSGSAGNGSGGYASGPSSAGNLPSTGASVLPTVLAGLAALMVGGALTLTARRRNLLAVRR